MAGFIDKILGTGKSAAKAEGSDNTAANPGPMMTAKLIGAGGEGAVYEDRDDLSMVIKVMHAQHTTPERAAKLRAMCDSPPQLPKPCQSYQYRSRIGVNIAEALRGLHATHVRIGDVNPSNILVDDDGAVTLIDCDSFQIPGPPADRGM